MLLSAASHRAVHLALVVALCTACQTAAPAPPPAPAQSHAAAPAPRHISAPAPAARPAIAVTRPQTPAAKPPAKQKAEVTLDLASPSAVLMDAGSGRVLFAKNEHDRRSPASITKLMTMLLAYEAVAKGKAKWNDQVVTSAHAVEMGGTQIYLEEGETLTLWDMMRAVAIASANDAAVAMAEHLAGSHEQFVQQMNAKAQEIGMNDTHFANSTGLDADGHVSSSYDLALLARYLVTYQPKVLELTRIYQDKLETPHRRRDKVFALDNRNKLVVPGFFPGADGLKTGFTGTSGYCLAATAKRGETRMVAVIMGSETPKLRLAETMKLLNYGFANYRTVLLAPGGKPLGSVRVLRGKRPTVTAVPRAPFGVSVAKGEENKVKLGVRLDPSVGAPVAQGANVGQLVAMLDGRELGRMDLVAANPVERATLWSSIGGALRNVFDFRR